jgi:hypothetical protein
VVGLGGRSRSAWAAWDGGSASRGGGGAASRESGKLRFVVRVRRQEDRPLAVTVFGLRPRENKRTDLLMFSRPRENKRTDLLMFSRPRENKRTDLLMFSGAPSGRWGVVWLGPGASVAVRPQPQAVLSVPVGDARVAGAARTRGGGMGGTSRSPSGTHVLRGSKKQKDRPFAGHGPRRGRTCCGCGPGRGEEGWEEPLGPRRGRTCCGGPKKQKDRPFAGQTFCGAGPCGGQEKGEHRQRRSGIHFWTR